MPGGFVDGFEDVLDGVDAFDVPPREPPDVDDQATAQTGKPSLEPLADDLDPAAVALVRRLFATGGGRPGPSRPASIDIMFADGTTLAVADGARLRIGRGDHADVRVDRAIVSRVHCLIGVDPGGATVVDLDSANGTVVLNGDGRVLDVGATPVALNPGDRIATAGGSVELARLGGCHE